MRIYSELLPENEMKKRIILKKTALGKEVKVVLPCEKGFLQ